MTRVLVICLVLFPVVFVATLVATGTLQHQIMPWVKAELDTRSGRDAGIEEAAPAYDVLDSLVVRQLEMRELRVQASLDSLEAVQTRIETERRELSELGASVREVVEQLEALRSSMEEGRDKERRAFAKVFSEMDPERAAQILGHLDPESVTYLVKTMQKRQAAEVLAMLDPRTAAALSDRIMHGAEAAR